MWDISFITLPNLKENSPFVVFISLTVMKHLILHIVWAADVSLVKDSPGLASPLHVASDSGIYEERICRSAICLKACS